MTAKRFLNIKEITEKEEEHSPPTEITFSMESGYKFAKHSFINNQDFNKNATIPNDFAVIKHGNKFFLTYTLNQVGLNTIPIILVDEKTRDPIEVVPREGNREQTPSPVPLRIKLLKNNFNRKQKQSRSRKTSQTEIIEISPVPIKKPALVNDQKNPVTHQHSIFGNTDPIANKIASDFYFPSLNNRGIEKFKILSFTHNNMQYLFKNEKNEISLEVNLDGSQFSLKQVLKEVMAANETIGFSVMLCDNGTHLSLKISMSGDFNKFTSNIKNINDKLKEIRNRTDINNEEIDPFTFTKK